MRIVESGIAQRRLATLSRHAVLAVVEVALLMEDEEEDKSWDDGSRDERAAFVRTAMPRDVSWLLLRKRRCKAALRIPDSLRLVSQPRKACLCGRHDAQKEASSSGVGG